MFYRFQYSVLQETVHVRELVNSNMMCFTCILYELFECVVTPHSLGAQVVSPHSLGAQVDNQHNQHRNYVSLPEPHRDISDFFWT